MNFKGLLSNNNVNVIDIKRRKGTYLVVAKLASTPTSVQWHLNVVIMALVVLTCHLYRECKAHVIQGQA